jgi:hypothetical protein
MKITEWIARLYLNDSGANLFTIQWMKLGEGGGVVSFPGTKPKNNIDNID